MRWRVWMVGALAAAAYLAAAAASFRAGLLPARPLYDGLAPPQPYRWVSPPPDLKESNELPEPVSDSLPLGDAGSEPRSLSTPDGQATVVFPSGAFPARSGESTVSVRISPQDPSTFPSPPPKLRIDGNVYRFEARYEASGGSAEPAKAVSLVLRYPAFGSVMLRWDGRRWQSLETQRAAGSLQLFADSDRLGAFAAAGVPSHANPWIRYSLIGGIGSLAAIAAGYVSARYAHRRRRLTRQRRRAAQRRRRKKRGW